MITVWVTFRMEGWHRWPQAPEERKYLSHSHRHMFHYKVEVAVDGQDREVECHDLRDHCLRWFRKYDFTPSGRLELGRLSCEMLATEMVAWVRLSWPERWVAVEVGEDGECGARVEVRP
jgi:hypothetical protein